MIPLKIMIKAKKIIITLALAIILIGCSIAEIDNGASNRTEDINPKNTSDADKTLIDEKQDKNNDSENKNDFAAIDWKYYENLMTTDDQEDFEEYLPALTNKEKFYCFDWCDEEVTFDEYLYSIESKEEVDIEGVALVDLDSQNGKELIIHLYEGGGNYLILTRDSDVIYGTNLGDRRFDMLQKDGKFIGSGGAADWYFHRLKIDSNGVEEITFGEFHGDRKDDGTYEHCFEVDGKKFEQDPQEWLAENYNDPVEWIGEEDDYY